MLGIVWRISSNTAAHCDYPSRSSRRDQVRRADFWGLSMRISGPGALCGRVRAFAQLNESLGFVKLPVFLGE